MNIKPEIKFKQTLEDIKGFGKLVIDNNIDESYIVKNKLLSRTELAWRRILLSANQKQTKIIWDLLLNPIKYGLLDRELTDAEKITQRRMLCKIDRVFLSQLLIPKGVVDHSFRKILNHEWVYNRCREVEKNSDGYLELWPRAHFKSVICNNLGVIQEHLLNPKITIIIITYAVSFAQDSYKFIKNVYEDNIQLKSLFPEIFYQDAESESPAGKWTSENFWLKSIANSNSREPSLAFCSITKIKTGRHFMKRIYDDIVTEDSVTSAITIDKVNKAISNSKNIGDATGPINREHFIGTRYHKNDSYQFLIDNKTVKIRLYKATHNGKLDGNPVLLTKEEWENKKKEHPYVVACQQLMEPTMSEDSIFELKYLKAYDIIRPMDIFIIVDPATSKKKNSDYTSIAVVGILNDNKYLLDGVRDKIDLKETWQHLKRLHMKWTDFLPDRGYSVNVAYEQFAASRDIEALNMLMDHENYYFDITKVGFGNDGIRSKQDRVGRLIPDLKRGRFYIPRLVWKNGKVFKWSYVYDKEMDMSYLSYEEVENAEQDIFFQQGTNAKTATVVPIMKTNYELEKYDYTMEFMEELENFPYGKHDDIVDSISRLYDFPDINSIVGQIQKAPTPSFIY